MFKTDDSSTIKDPLEIYNLLKNIQKSKQLISLSFESLPQLCLTSLLEVQLDKEILVFDETNPVLTSQQIQKRNEAAFSLKLNNLPVSFKSKLVSNTIANNTTSVQTYFPKEIFYPQNRNYYRFRTEFINDVETTLYMSSTNRLPGQLLDISLKGLCLRIPYSHAKKFKINQLIRDIHVQLPKQQSFSISARIKNSRIENNYSNITLGLEIQQQQSLIEKKIQQFIFRTQNI